MPGRTTTCAATADRRGRRTTRLRHPDPAPAPVAFGSRRRHYGHDPGVDAAVDRLSAALEVVGGHLDAFNWAPREVEMWLPALRELVSARDDITRQLAEVRLIDGPGHG